MNDFEIKVKLFTDEINKCGTIYQQQCVILKWLTKIISMIEDGSISQIKITADEETGDITIITKDTEVENNG